MLGNIGLTAGYHITQQRRELSLPLSPQCQLTCPSGCARKLQLSASRDISMSPSSLTLDWAVTTQCWAKLARTGLETGQDWLYSTLDHCTLGGTGREGATQSDAKHYHVSVSVRFANSSDSGPKCATWWFPPEIKYLTLGTRSDILLSLHLHRSTTRQLDFTEYYLTVLTKGRF